MTIRHLFASVLCLWLLAACGAPPLLPAASVRPETITPNGDGKDEALEVSYTLAAGATISVTLIGPDGRAYVLRKAQLRSPGTYSFLFGGVLGGMVLPNGAYGVRIEALPADGGAPELAERSFKIEGSTLTLPEIQNFTVFPHRFTPNRDGIDDRVSMAYNLTKKADVLVYLRGKDGSKWPVPERLDNAARPGDPGVHTYDYEGGVDLGAQPPPDGDYIVVAEATDALGNTVVATNTLTVADGGVPRAEIIGATARIAPTSVPLGSSLVFTATVGNIGTTPVRTKGPWSGTEYDSIANFNGLGEYEEPGVFRIGMDFEGNSTGRFYPYRWGIGSPSQLTVKTVNGKDLYYLMPGQRVQVTGRVRMTDKSQFNPLAPYFWVGLYHEQVRIVNDRIAPTKVTIGF
ncbi:MAG: hypothetical protein HZB53_19485 [Chloroflexi bacterium]|nr:hypothetical protein [Chloroflexota bacterium]